ncbi:SPW repeat-containing protein [Rhizobiales bacterium GAS191]|nr:SPW repeat-containing protein [Rhizobiales bacterium GAS113]SED31719.1 SPW repeat-containing protein [Rhizobiales bacterium GAS191]
MSQIMTRDTKESAIDVINAVLGVGLALSPWAFGFTHEAAAAWNAWLVGAVIALIAIGALVAFAEWEEWANLILGAWAIIAPFMLGFGGMVSAARTHIVVGLIVVVLAAVELWWVHHRPLSTA